MYLFRNRDTRCGEWDCGNLKMPLPPLTDVVLRAVQLLAVKKLDTTACRKQSNEDFLELVFSVSKLKHANVVELVGYCAEHGQQLLVFLGGDFGAGFLSPTLSA